MKNFKKGFYIQTMKSWNVQKNADYISICVSEDINSDWAEEYCILGLYIVDVWGHLNFLTHEGESSKQYS